MAPENETANAGMLVLEYFWLNWTSVSRHQRRALPFETLCKRAHEHESVRECTSI